MIVRTAAFWSLLFTVASVGQAQQPSAPKPSTESKEKAQPAAESKGSAASAGGAIVFVDPVTRQIRQPSDAEIGALSALSAVTTAGRAAPVLIQGPNGAVGAKLADDSLSYMIVTKAVDGKLVLDCVTGDKAAELQMKSGAPPAEGEKAKPTPQR
jgi:hypothetical protein